MRKLLNKKVIRHPQNQLITQKVLGQKSLPALLRQPRPSLSPPLRLLCGWGPTKLARRTFQQMGSSSKNPQINKLATDTRKAPKRGSKFVNHMAEVRWRSTWGRIPSGPAVLRMVHYQSLGGFLWFGEAALTMWCSMPVSTIILAFLVAVSQLWDSSDGTEWHEAATCISNDRMLLKHLSASPSALNCSQSNQTE